MHNEVGALRFGHVQSQLDERNFKSPNKPGLPRSTHNSREQADATIGLGGRQPYLKTPGILGLPRSTQNSGEQAHETMCLGHHLPEGPYPESPDMMTLWLPTSSEQYDSPKYTKMLEQNGMLLFI
jgi:hypothetical protein